MVNHSNPALLCSPLLSLVCHTQRHIKIHSLAEEGSLGIYRCQVLTLKPSDSLPKSRGKNSGESYGIWHIDARILSDWSLWFRSIAIGSDCIKTLMTQYMIYVLFWIYVSYQEYNSTTINSTFWCSTCQQYTDAQNNSPVSSFLFCSFVLKP